jgi:hypothetical protein
VVDENMTTKSVLLVPSSILSKTAVLTAGSDELAIRHLLEMREIERFAGRFRQ